jgi:diguanylate cyclase (GGDEF)-like protein
VRRPSPDTDSDGLLTDPVHGKPHRCAGPPTGDNPTVAVLRFGLDGFKAYNARHTRAAGDAVLREVANRLRTVLDEWGDGGEIARVRGDEFVVLAPGADEPGAGSLAARLHSVCRWPARGRAAFGGWTLGATGVTTWAVCGRSAEQVLRASGELLHHRKAQ